MNKHTCPACKKDCQLYNSIDYAVDNDLCVYCGLTNNNDDEVDIWRVIR